MSVGYVYDAACLQHDTGGDPEGRQRLEMIMAHLQSTGLLARLHRVEAKPASLSDLARAHDPSLIERVRALAEEQGGGYIDLDTVVSRGSYAAARAAAGAAIAGVRAALAGEVESAFALVRPPGHHATRRRAMGFCLFNNVAVAALWALARGGASRLAIVDLDVHHGNGTQNILGGDERVLFASLHQYPFYPGTGHWRDTGAAGLCLNVPLPANAGDTAYALAMERLVAPALRRHRPEIILVSIGYDGHWADPLAWILLSLAGYRHLFDCLVSLAGELCGGRLVACLEGGYDLQVLAHGVASSFGAMLGEPLDDPFGPAREPESRVDGLIAAIARHHGLGGAT